jgi:hypothetical protein
MRYTIKSKIKFKPVIQSLDLSDEDWQLYTKTMDCTKVAEKLNNTFVACVNQGLDKHQTRVKMNHIMGLNSKFGAADSEPIYVLGELINLVFAPDTAR